MYAQFLCIKRTYKEQCMNYYEVNFDGLVGPTHNYAGLSFGNVASTKNVKMSSEPKKAALQGLKKMHFLHNLGVKQGILAPNARPDITTLRSLGFSGTDKQVITKVANQKPELLPLVYSASSMWTANAATVSSSLDTNDGKTHFTVANLHNKFHRSIEVKTTKKILKEVFKNDAHFTHHDPLPNHSLFGDEGAANFTRLSSEHSQHGLSIFVYGQNAKSSIAPIKFPARQTLAASEAIARSHGLKEDKTFFIQQNPDTIDQGVFHNDVIAVGNENVFLFHEQAFLSQQKVINNLKQSFIATKPLHLIEVKNDEISISDAIESYVFNSQLVTLPSGSMAIIAPTECQYNDRVATYLFSLTKSSAPISDIIYMDLKQSMSNGGGPACLRLRVLLNEQEIALTNSACLMNDTNYKQLCQWVNKHYRESLSSDDLKDPELLVESYSSLDELTQLLNIGSVYDFQQI